MLKSTVTAKIKNYIFQTKNYVLPGLVCFLPVFAGENFWQNFEVGGRGSVYTTHLPVPPLLVAMVEEHTLSKILQGVFSARWCPKLLAEFSGNQRKKGWKIPNFNIENASPNDWLVFPASHVIVFGWS